MPGLRAAATLSPTTTDMCIYRFSQQGQDKAGLLTFWQDGTRVSGNAFKGYKIVLDAIID